MDPEDAGKDGGVLGVSMSRLTLALVVESLVGGAVYTFPELRGKVVEDLLLWRLVPVALAIVLISALSTVATAAISSRRRPFHSVVSTCLRFLRGWLVGIPYLHLSVVLFGASLTEFRPTLLLAAVLSSLTVGPLATTAPLSQLWTTAFVPSSWKRRDLLLHFRALGSLVGAWFGATLIPLDWAQPWQEFPLPVVVGAVLGHNLGAVTALVVEGCWQGQQSEDSKGA